MLAALAHLNWFAVGLAGLAYYLLGAAWFTPLFGRAWDRSRRPRQTQPTRRDASWPRPPRSA